MSTINYTIWWSLRQAFKTLGADYVDRELMCAVIYYHWDLSLREKP